jgi:hypothetical protein
LLVRVSGTTVGIFFLAYLIEIIFFLFLAHIVIGILVSRADSFPLLLHSFQTDLRSCEFFEDRFGFCLKIADEGLESDMPRFNAQQSMVMIDGCSAFRSRF